MATIEPRPARPSLFARAINWALTLFVVGFLVVMLFLVWPMFMERLHTSMPNLPLTLSTAAVAPRAPAQPRTESAPALNLEQIGATSTAIYQATAAAVDAQHNVNITGDTVPVITGEKPAARQGAGANVPTAEPIAPVESDEQTGSKPVLVNPQESHACRHAQVWTDIGCKNPTPVQ